MLETPRIEFENFMTDVDDKKAKLASICNPLLKLLDIDHFCPLVVTNNSIFTGLHTNTFLAKEWIYSGYPLPIAPSSGFYLATSFPEIFTDCILATVKDKYDTDNILFYVEKHRNYQNMYAFSSRVGKKNIINNYLNNTQKIKEFIGCFKTEAKELMQLNQRNSFIYVQDIPLMQSSLTGKSDIIFLETVKLEKSVLHEFENNLLFLSEREYQCLQLTSTMKTAKEIAKILNISHRTVEAYLANAKFKLRVANKSEMVSAFIDVTS